MAAHHHDHAPAHGTHVPGTMDIREQEKTFDGFMRFTVWVVGIIFAVLVFLALSSV